MIKKTIIATALAGIVAGFGLVQPAKADVSIGIQVGPGVGFYTPGAAIIAPGVRRGYTCRQGRQIVRSNGFRRVRTIRCGGRTHLYRARAQGDRYQVRVHALSGEIIAVRPY